MGDWDPDLYQRYREVRMRPLRDLFELLPHDLAGRWLDLGCGDGAPVAWAAELHGPESVVGVDASAAMLDRAQRLQGPFAWEHADAVAWLRASTASFDLVLSNALLHWLDDHAGTLDAMMDRLEPGGWLAVQMPMNHTAPTHTTMERVASEAPFDQLLAGFRVHWPQREPEFYRRHLARRLDLLAVEVRTYRMVVPSPAAILAFTAATALRPWLQQLSESAGRAFSERYVELLGEAYPPLDDAGRRVLDYRRLLAVGRRPRT